MVASLVNAVLNPFAAGAPAAPVEPPTMWTLLAFVRREFEPTVSNESPTVNPLAGQIANGLVTDTPTLDDQSIDPAITGRTGAPLAGMSDLTSLTQLNATAAPATFTGEPSIVSQVTTAAFRILRAFTDFIGYFGVDTAITNSTTIDERQSAVVYHAGTERPAQRVRGDVGMDFAAGKPVGEVRGGHPRGRVHCSAQTSSIGSITLPWPATPARP